MIFLLSIHKTIDGKMTKLDSVQDGCWVNLTYPSEDELNTVAATLGVEPTFLRAALDEEETSRIDTEDGQTLIIIDVPAVEKDDAVVYSTLPLGIIVTEQAHHHRLPEGDPPSSRTFRTDWCGLPRPRSGPALFSICCCRLPSASFST